VPRLGKLTNLSKRSCSSAGRCAVTGSAKPSCRRGWRCRSLPATRCPRWPDWPAGRHARQL